MWKVKRKKVWTRGKCGAVIHSGGKKRMRLIFERNEAKKRDMAADCMRRRGMELIFM